MIVCFEFIEKAIITQRANNKNYNAIELRTKKKWKHTWSCFRFLSLFHPSSFYMARVNLLKNQGFLSLFLIVMVVLSTMIPQVKAWTEGIY